MFVNIWHISANFAVLYLLRKPLSFAQLKFLTRAQVALWSSPSSGHSLYTLKSFSTSSHWFEEFGESCVIANGLPTLSLLIHMLTLFIYLQPFCHNLKGLFNPDVCDYELAMVLLYDNRTTTSPVVRSSYCHASQVIMVWPCLPTWWAAIIIQGTVEDRRPRKSWKDNKEWTGQSLLHIADDRSWWAIAITTETSVWVPQRCPGITRLSYLMLQLYSTLMCFYFLPVDTIYLLLFGFELFCGLVFISVCPSHPDTIVIDTLASMTSSRGKILIQGETGHSVLFTHMYVIWKIA